MSLSCTHLSTRMSMYFASHQIDLPCTFCMLDQITVLQKELAELRNPTIPVVGTCPEYKNDHDAGADLRSAVDTTVLVGTFQQIPTQTSIALPPGLVAFVCPRSGLATQGVTVLNGPGVIDAGYRGVISVILVNVGIKPLIVQKNDRIAQLVIVPFTKGNFVAVEQLPAPSDTRIGGHGSTGVK